MQIRTAIEDIYTDRAQRRYGLSSVNQLQHALQSAALAEQNGEPVSLIVAALLHVAFAKDEGAAKAGPGWAKRTAFNRGQILYRLAEMMEARDAELAEAIMLGGSSKVDAAREVAASIERVVHYAGWTDKYEQILEPYARCQILTPVEFIGTRRPLQETTWRFGSKPSTWTWIRSTDEST